MVYLFLADGFEEIEGLTVVDILRRGGVELTTVSIMESDMIHGSHNIFVKADAMLNKVDLSDADMLVLPGGGVGTENLLKHEGVKKAILSAHASGTYLAAICAAPSVLGLNGILKGKEAICYPGFEEKLLEAKVKPGARVVVDGNVITSRGMGTALDFSLELLGILKGVEVKEKIAAAIQYV